MKKKTRNKLLVVLLVFGVAGGLFYVYGTNAGLWDIWWGDAEPEPEVLSFDNVNVHFEDLVNGFAIDDDDLAGLLYTTVDLDDEYDYKQIHNYSTSVNIDANDFEDDLDSGESLILEVWGVCDESVYEEIDDDHLGDRTYYHQLFQIDPYRNQTIKLAQEPTDAGYAALNTETFAALSLPYLHSANITFIVGANSSLTDGIYITQSGLKNEYTVNLLLEFNTTIDKSDVTMSDATLEAVNTTALVAHLHSYNAQDYALRGGSPRSFVFTFKDTISTNNITACTLRYGSTAI